MNLSIDFTNCFGIRKLKTNFNFSNDNKYFVVYASNGTMKSSFAKTFLYYADGKEPIDRIFEDRKGSCEIKLDDTLLDPKAIFVVNPDDEIDTKEKISSFIASKELKKKYDSIYSFLDAEKKIFIANLKSKSQSTDCESEIVETFKEIDSDDLFSCLKRIQPDLCNEYRLYSFRYNDVFDKKGHVKKFIEKNGSLIQEYMDRYVELLEKSDFFHKGQENQQSFGMFQADTISKSVSDGAFFQAEHKMILKGDLSVGSHDELKKIIDNEWKKINDDDKLKKTFDKIEKEIDKNAELRAFENILEQDRSIIPSIQKYDDFKKQVWYGYLKSLQNEVESLVKKYNEKLVELQKIIEDAKKENDRWNTIIKIYNSRFHVPFEVILENQEDVILKEKVATLNFKYKDNREQKICDKDKITNVLSKGEKRAFFMLQFLFEIEARKAERKPTILVCDDIADSFDYKNKYAIIEYLKDLKDDDTNLFYAIILTHNFDFYRTIASRLGISRSNLWTATKCDSEIKINQKGKYIRDAFAMTLGGSVNNPRIFISLIPFARNIIEYTKGQDSSNYKLLTSCLHLKKGSDIILVSDIFDIMKKALFKLQSCSISYGTKKVQELIYDEAENISVDQNLDETALENKFTLSIAIRLLAEKYMIAKLGEKADLDNITKDQTRDLYDKYRKNFTDDSIICLDKVNLMTPENIHVNAFMFEPLIDMSVYHLISLYNNVKALI